MTQIAKALRGLSPPQALDKVWIAIALIVAGILVLAPQDASSLLGFSAGALFHTLPFILFAVVIIAWLKASGAEAVIARAFQGRESTMILLAALIGGLAPFCSCEVIPFIAGLLALGTPLSAVMAFWLASPLIDPAALIITAGALGWPFAIAKTIAAVGIGLLGGFAIKFLRSGGLFADPLRQRKSGCGGCGPALGERKVLWSFWKEAKGRETFGKEAAQNGHFLLKWLSLAYLLEGLMVHYVPASAIAGIVGGEGLGPVLLSGLVGAPAYLNSYAAPPLVSGLMEQGMSAAAGMTFIIAGAVSSIPAMTAVFALVKREVFVAYLALGYLGAVLSGLIYGLTAS